MEAVFAPYGEDDVVHAGLRELAALRRTLDALEAELVVEGRRRGYGWAELGAQLGLGLHGMRRRHLGRDPVYARKLSLPPTPEEGLRQLLASLRRA